MHIKNSLIQVYYWIVYYIPCIAREIIKGQTSSNSLPVISFLDIKWGKLRKANWGDDMNVYLCNQLLNKQIICYNTSVLSWVFHRRNYALIGSILQNANHHTVVWGSGLHSEKELPRETPLKICAVRGRLTRERLISHGFSCPEVYGDPILLLPKLYTPKTKRKYKLGIIPHFMDENNRFIQNYVSSTPGVTLVSMKHYERWQDVVDKICGCEKILSSSLHGLIVSDAYNIPNCWVEFSNKVYGNGFKFRDYFSSVNRENTEVVRIEAEYDFEKAIDKLNDYKPIQIDLQPLVESCPFPLPLHL